MSKETVRSVEPEPAAPQPVAVPAGPAPALPRHGGALSAGGVLALQQRVGNAAVASLLARQSVPAPTDAGPAPAGGVTTPTPAEEITAFRARTFPPLADHQPASGLGQFDVALNAATGVLTITLKVGYTFVAGSGRAARGFRAAELQWTPAEQNQWKADYQAGVSSQWSAAHLFTSTKPGWDAVTVRTAVVVVEDAADPHFIVTVSKFPRDAPLVTSSICPPGTHHDGNACMPNAPAAAGGGPAPHGTASFDSNDLRPESKLDGGNPVVAVPFGPGGVALSGAATTALAPVIAQLQANAAARAVLRGRASSTRPRGSTDDADAAIRNMDIARNRSAAVQSALVTAGIAPARLQQINHGDRDAGPQDEWRRVDVQVATLQTQDVGVHETGHMLGLADEYLDAGEATGAPVAAGYGAMVQTQTGSPVTKADDASAMSMGSTVRPHHFSSFLAALKSISGMEEWRL